MNGNFLEEFIDAYEFAKERHSGQTRVDGSPYLGHLVRTADIVRSEGFQLADGEVIRACLLHDVVEDTSTTLDEIRKRFGERIAYIVDGVTKMETEEETIEKIREYSNQDSGVIAVKLADRIHNMRSLNHEVWSLSENQKRKRKILKKYALSNPHYIQIGKDKGLTSLPYHLCSICTNLRDDESNRESLSPTT